MDIKYLGKYMIYGELICLTGLHIGGSEEEYEIGGMDNPVIKNPLDGKPYIPGSSLKGKLRYMLEWAQGKVNLYKKSNLFVGEPCRCGKEDCQICIIFGASGGKQSLSGPTRLTVYDAFPTKKTCERWEAILGENVFTEIKMENSLDRLTSVANPRPLERVPQGSSFNVTLAFDLFCEEDEKRLKNLFQALALLEDSGLGGSVSRGSGRVKFQRLQAERRGISYYTGDEKAEVIELGEHTPLEICHRFDEFFLGV